MEQQLLELSEEDGLHDLYIVHVAHPVHYIKIFVQLGDSFLQDVVVPVFLSELMLLLEAKAFQIVEQDFSP